MRKMFKNKGLNEGNHDPINIATGHERRDHEATRNDVFTKGHNGRPYSTEATYPDVSIAYHRPASRQLPSRANIAAYKAAVGHASYEIRSKNRKQKAVAVIAGAVLLAAVTSRTAHDKSSEAIDAQARDRFGSMNYSQQFVASYVMPDMQMISTKEGGFGVLGIMQRLATIHELSIGSDCLAGTAYDPTASLIGGLAYGAIKSNTTMGINNDHNFVVTPAGGDVAALEFAIDEGRITPTEQTSDTLRSNGCNPDPNYSFGGRTHEF